MRDNLSIVTVLQYVLNPVFSPGMIKQMDTSSKQCIAFDGKSYLAGIVGLNNIKANDYCNVIMHVSVNLYVCVTVLNK